MPRDGSGNFSRVYDWTTDEGNSVPITASRMDSDTDDIATELTNSVAKDGQSTMSGNLKMGSNKITGLATGTAATDGATVAQTQGSSQYFGLTGGTSTAFTLSPSPAITAYTTGAPFKFQPHTDSGATPTINISALGAKNLKKFDGAGAKVAIEAGDLQDDQYYHAYYDGTDILIDNPQRPYFDSRNLSIATETEKGVAEIATDAEAVAATADDKIITPKKQKFLNQVYKSTSSVTTGSTAIPFDNTIHQNTEGDQVIAADSYTPASATNKLIIEGEIYMAVDAAVQTCASIFQDSTANALKSSYQYSPSSGAIICHKFKHEMTAGSTSATVFKIRAGASSGTCTFNGTGGSGIGGGVLFSSITITERKA